MNISLSSLISVPRLLEILSDFLPGKNQEHRRRSLKSALEAGDPNTLRMVEAALALPAYTQGQALRATVLDGLKGRFTKQEITVLADTMNGVLWEPRQMLRPEYIVFELEDFEKHEGGISRHGADPAALLEKAKALNSAERFFLIQELLEFWHWPAAYGSPTPSLEKLWQRFA